MAITVNDLRSNYGLFALAMHPDWMYATFQQDILAPALDKIAACDPTMKRTIITAPFRFSKSEFCIETFIPFYMGRNPSHTVILLSYAHKLARKFGREIRDRMRHPLYLQVFPHAEVAKGSRASDEFTTLAGGKFYAAGFDGRINGVGTNLLCIDDPTKHRAEALSDAVRTFQRDIYTNTVQTRLEPDAAILIVTTRWTPDDLVGWRCEEDGAYDYLMKRPYVDVARRTC